MKKKQKCEEEVETRRSRKVRGRRSIIAGWERERRGLFFLKSTEGHYGLFTISAGCTSKTAGAPSNTLVSTTRVHSDLVD